MGEVVLSVWISLIMRHAVKNTTQVTMKYTRSVECRESERDQHQVSPSPVSVPLPWPLCSELHRSRCSTYALNSPVTNSDNSHSATGCNEIDLSIEASTSNVYQRLKLRVPMAIAEI